MAGKTRDQVRQEASERRVDPSTFAGKQAVSLEEEAERIKREIEAGGGGAELTPGQEAEAEAEAAIPKIINPTTGLAARLAARRAAATPQAPSVDRSGAVAGVVDNAYKRFLASGYEPETARSLTQSYALIELGIVLDSIAKKI